MLSKPVACWTSVSVAAAVTGWSEVSVQPRVGGFFPSQTIHTLWLLTWRRSVCCWDRKGWQSGTDVFSIWDDYCWSDYSLKLALETLECRGDLVKFMLFVWHRMWLKTLAALLPVVPCLRWCRLTSYKSVAGGYVSCNYRPQRLQSFSPSFLG